MGAAAAGLITHLLKPRPPTSFYKLHTFSNKPQRFLPSRRNAYHRGERLVLVLPFPELLRLSVHVHRRIRFGCCGEEWPRTSLTRQNDDDHSLNYLPTPCLLPFLFSFLYYYIRHQKFLLFALQSAIIMPNHPLAGAIIVVSVAVAVRRPFSAFPNPHN